MTTIVVGGVWAAAIPFVRRLGCVISVSIAVVLAVVLAAGSATATEDLGDAEIGAKLWKFCAPCHDVGENARNKIGPHLNNLFGRRAAELEGFRYSDPMKRAGSDGVVWDRDTLDVFIENPRALVSRTRMSFRGVADEKHRADIIAFLRQFSASPSDIPESAPTALPSNPDEELDPAIFAIEGDHAYGEYLSSECLTCHQADGGDDGIPSITGWPSRHFVTAMHAYKKKLRPHPVMQMMAGRLSDEEIASLAVYFESLK